MPTSPAQAGARALVDPVFPPPAPDGAVGPPPGAGADDPSPEPAPGLFEQIGSTRDSAKRLVGAHVELAKAEFADIADAAKRTAAFAGVAFAAALFAGLLLGVGIPLWLGEWIFGSLGWGILLGVLLLAALALAAVIFAIGPSVNGHVGRSFVIAAIIGIVVGVIFGLDITNRGWTLLADNVAAGMAQDSRPLVVAVAAVGVIGAIVGLIAEIGRAHV